MSSMEGSSNLVPQPNGPSPNDWNQNPSTPHHPTFTSTQLGSPNSYEGDMLNGCIYYSAKDDVIYVPNFIPPNSPLLIKLLESALDEGHIEQSLYGVKTILPQLMRLSIDGKEGNGRGQNDPKEHPNTTQYRGVIKCNEKRFEAFVKDNTMGGWKGKTVYIGGYETEIEAAKAHDLVSLKLVGSNNFTNFPGSCYWNEIHEMQITSKSEYIQTIRRRGKGVSGSDIDYRGVYRSVGSQQWQAWLGRDKGFPGIFLGSYNSKEDAARGYDIAVARFKGVEAITNFELKNYEVKNSPAVISMNLNSLHSSSTTATPRAHNSNNGCFNQGLIGFQSLPRSFPAGFGTQILGGDVNKGIINYPPFNNVGPSTSPLVWCGTPRPTSAAATYNVGVGSLALDSCDHVTPPSDQVLGAAPQPPLQQPATVVEDNLNSIEDDFDILQFLDADFMEDYFAS